MSEEQRHAPYWVLNAQGHLISRSVIILTPEQKHTWQHKNGDYLYPASISANEEDRVLSLAYAIALHKWSVEEWTSPDIDNARKEIADLNESWDEFYDIFPEAIDRWASEMRNMDV